MSQRQIDLLYARSAYARQVRMPEARHLVRMMAVRAPVLSLHCGQVAHFAALLASALALPAETAQAVRVAAELHDVGKLVARPRPMVGQLRRSAAPDEHPLLGEWLCLAAGLSQEVQRAVRLHHEWFDGTGYPDALKGGEIPIAARIIAAADTYANLIVPTRTGLGPPEVRAEMLRQGGSRLDPELVETLLQQVAGLPLAPSNHARK